MSPKTDGGVKVGRGHLPCVTREEIAVTGRILQSIDLSNQIVASVSQWLLIWKNVRELSFRIEDSPIEAQQTVAESFKRLLNECIQIGKKLVDLVGNLEISNQHLSSATGCDTAGIAACISYLEDTLEFHFGEPVSLDFVREVWAQFPSEPNSVV